MFGIGLQEVILLLPLVADVRCAAHVAAPGPHRASCRATRRRQGTDQSFRRRSDTLSNQLYDGDDRG